jgi:hypothetical protein
MAEPGPHARAGATRWPQPHHWRRHGTRLQHWSGRRQSVAWQTRRPGCPRGTRHSPTWSDECPGSQPVGVGVDDQVGAGRAMQQQVEVRRPTKIAQDALRGRQVGLLRVVHVQADLLHDISDVGPCERQVLEGSSNALELRGVRNRRPRVVS